MWKDLSIQQKSEVMKMAISQGLTDLNEIKKMYDASIPNIEASSVNNTYSSVPYNPSPKDVRYDDGGRLAEVIITPNRDYNIFLNSLPPNQKYGDDNFNTYRYWELHGKPADFEAALKTSPPMYTLEDDGYYHASTVAYNRDNDTYEFMKSPDHPTVDLELLQYWNNPELNEFRNNYGLDLNSNPYKYIRRESTNKPLYAYGGPLGNIYKGTGNKSQKLSKAERENRAMWAKGQPFYEEMSLWNTGLSDVALAGILGNIGLESGFDYKSTKGTHHGYLQNQDSIRDYIKKYYGGYGHKEQMQYLRDGLTGKLRGRDSSIGKQMQARFDGYIKAVANVTDPIVASQLWEQHYERSKGQAMGKRQRYAKYFYEQLTPQEKQELAQQMTSPEMDYNTRFAGQLAVDPNFLYLDPSMSFFDALTKAGVHFKTSNPSGYRSPAQQKAMGFKTKDSQHSHKRDDGTAWALDIVPAKGYTFADLQRELTHPALQVYFRNNGLGVYDETTQEVLAKTGGTGPHYHVGRNKFGPKGSMAITYNNWVKKYNPALPEAYKMPIDLVEVSPEQSVYHHPANDLVWNPPTTEITPEDLNREIAPLLMQDNKPLIVEPLNNSEPSKSFDDIWDQIFPKVENTQEEFNPLLDPSTQFTALQSRPRYQMKPTPIINMPVSNGDNDYMLFKPLAKGGNLFDTGSFMTNIFNKVASNLANINMMGEYGETLPTLTITPSSADRFSEYAMREMFPDKQARRIAADDIFKWATSNQGQDPNYVIDNLHTLYHKAGKPSLNFGSSLINVIGGLFNQENKYRSNYLIPPFNTITVPKEYEKFDNDSFLNNYLAELSHALQYNDVKKDVEDVTTYKDFIDPEGSYDRPHTVEYNAHNIIEPEIKSILKYPKVVDKNLPDLAFPGLYNSAKKEVRLNSQEGMRGIQRYLDGLEWDMKQAYFSGENANDPSDVVFRSLWPNAKKAFGGNLFANGGA